MSRGSGTLPARWRESRPVRTAAGRWGGFASTVVFALYNGALGLGHTSLWHGSICAYYILLSLLRGALLAAERWESKMPESAPARWKKRVFYGLAGMMLALNGTLVVPAALMVLSRRPVGLGMIPAIATATYTTCKMTAAALGLREKGGNIFAQGLGVLRFADGLASVLVLQNTLITVMDGEVKGEMFYLSAAASGGIFLLIFWVSLLWLRKGRKNLERGR